MGVKIGVIMGANMENNHVDKPEMCAIKKLQNNLLTKSGTRKVCNEACY